jgi:hypothetical protein
LKLFYIKLVLHYLEMYRIYICSNWPHFISIINKMDNWITKTLYKGCILPLNLQYFTFRKKYGKMVSINFLIGLNNYILKSILMPSLNIFFTNILKIKLRPYFNISIKTISSKYMKLLKLLEVLWNKVDFE